MTWGRNDSGQLGLGDTLRRDEPTEVTALNGHQIIAGAVGRGHTLFLTSKGQVFACGDNKVLYFDLSFEWHLTDVLNICTDGTIGHW